ncbi:MAG: DNA polymerase III subunit gamma/tau [Clostridia bacterium]|nr:DNA polymerase III subunit gamma/tau [Clostridia bacterium]
MYQVLYRKYRPKVFSDVVGQNHITTTLSKEIETGKLSHAYLFTGSRGTGKTTCAKILSKAVNCLNPVDGNPCNECEICKGLESGAILDVVEIDAASNNGVENIRDIREEINFTPASCKYRVYIIDEVHMLSIGAFNALLKTLEEPPAHVKFILATTEVHKLPVTILSRCQRFDFKRVTPEAMSERMNYIAQSEGFTIDEEAASLIARIADGGMRDALSLLDQCTGHGKHITADIVVSVAGMTGKDHLFALADAVRNKDSAAALKLISDLYQDSCDMERLCADMINHFRSLMIVKTVRSSEGLVVCTDEELESYKSQSSGFTLEGILSAIGLLQECMANIKRGVNRRIETEMTFIKMSTPSLSADTDSILSRIADIEFKLKTGSFTVKETVQTKSEAPAEPKKEEPVKEAAAIFSTAFDLPAEPTAEEAYPMFDTAPAEMQTVPAEPISGTAPQEENIQWAEVLSELMKTNMPLWGVLVNSQAVIKGDFVLIKSDNPTLNSFIKAGRNAKDVKEAIMRVTGKKYRLGVYNGAQAENANATQKVKKDPLENLISNARSMGINVDVKP